jgi:hypothetical protein
MWSSQSVVVAFNFVLRRITLLPMKHLLLLTPYFTFVGASGFIYNILGQQKAVKWDISIIVMWLK